MSYSFFDNTPSSASEFPFSYDEIREEFLEWFINYPCTCGIIYCKKNYVLGKYEGYIECNHCGRRISEEYIEEKYFSEYKETLKQN